MPLRPRSFTSLPVFSPTSTLVIPRCIFPARRTNNTSYAERYSTSVASHPREQLSCAEEGASNDELASRPIEVVPRSAGWENKRWAPEIAARRRVTKIGSSTSEKKTDTPYASDGRDEGLSLVSLTRKVSGLGMEDGRGRDVETGNSTRDAVIVGASSDDDESRVTDEVKKCRRETQGGYRTTRSAEKHPGSTRDRSGSKRSTRERSRSTIPNAIATLYPEMSAPSFSPFPSTTTHGIPPIIHDMLSRRLYRLAVFHILSDISLRTDEKLLANVRYWLYYGRERHASIPGRKSSPSSSSSSSSASASSSFPPHPSLHKTQTRSQQPSVLAIRLGYTHTGRGENADALHRKMVYEMGKLPSLREVRAAHEMDRRGKGNAQEMEGRGKGQEKGDGKSSPERAHHGREGMPDDNFDRGHDLGDDDRRRSRHPQIVQDDSSERQRIELERQRTRAGNQKLSSMLLGGPRRPVLALAHGSSNRAVPSESGAIASSRPSVEDSSNTIPLQHISGTQSHSRQLSQLLYTLDRLRSTGFQPDLVTLNIIIKCFARGLSASHTERVDDQLAKHHPSPWRRSELGRETGTLLMRSFAPERFDPARTGSLDQVGWEEHVRPLSKMLIKAYKGMGDLEMAGKVLKWKVEVKAMCAKRAQEERRESSGRS